MRRIQHEWDNPHITGRNREASHAPLWGYADFAAAQRCDRTTGPYSLSLDGAWRFHLAPAPLAVPDGFWTPEFDDSAWEEIAVPSNWQLRPGSADKPIYTNIAYPFQADPPFAPEQNPTGCYRRSFDLPAAWAGREVRIIFEGVDSAFHLWVNGVEVGYSTDSRLPAEFSITPWLRPGRNTVAVRVLRYSVGTYLEDQDYWQMSGIQRSVRLLAKPPAHVRDFRVRTEFDARYEDATLDVTVYLETRDLPRQSPSPHWSSFYADLGATIALLDAEGRTVLEAGPLPFSGQTNVYGETFYEKGAARFRVPMTRPHQWSPETPHLYTLVMTLRDGAGQAIDVESCRVGFRQVEVRNRQLLLNGRRLVIRGVDRHEFHPERGRAVTVEDMRRDILQMKRLNFNAVRTSHYPNDPRWYELCDELGLCLVDEANLETHGLGGQIAEDPDWAGAFLERAVRMVLRDRNHPSVCFWSLGNESFDGPHHAAMANWVRRCDPTRPVQYEGKNPGPFTSDIMTPMYPGLDWVREIMEDPCESRPMILCEYAFAKGNATGNFKKFWDLVDHYPAFQGGFIWDWADKLIQIALPDGRRVYGYGNDLGEKLDYASFGEHGSQVFSGIVGADLEPHPGAYEVKKVQAPVGFLPVPEHPCRVSVWNKHHTLGLDHLTLVWELLEDGRPLRSGARPMPDARPGDKVVVDLPFELPICGAPGAEYFLSLCAQLNRDLPWAAAGHVVAWEQFPLPVRGPAALPRPTRASAPPRIEERTETIAVTGADGWSLEWRRSDGLLCSWKQAGIEWLAAPVQEIFHRAPTDNDIILGYGTSYAKEWETSGLPALTRRLLELSVTPCGERTVLVCADCELRGSQPEQPIRSRLEARIDADGNLTLEHQVVIPPAFALLSRLGLHLQLVPGFEALSWYGRGPWENYLDRKESALIGRWQGTVSGMLEAYPVPGECGGREDVRQLALPGPGGRLLTVEGAPAFHFSALHLTPEALTAAQHLWELAPGPQTSLILDGWHMGVGGDTGWSRNVHPEYLLRPGTYRWGLRLARGG